MSKLCESCHHRPSMRCGDPAYCYCKCHDVADAAPGLLEAAEYAAEMLSQPAGEESIAMRLAGVGGLRAQRLLQDAIAKAEGRPS